MQLSEDKSHEAHLCVPKCVQDFVPLLRPLKAIVRGTFTTPNLRNRQLVQTSRVPWLPPTLVSPLLFLLSDSIRFLLASSPLSPDRLRLFLLFDFLSVDNLCSLLHTLHFELSFPLAVLMHRK